MSYCFQGIYHFLLLRCQKSESPNLIRASLGCYFQFIFLFHLIIIASALLIPCLIESIEEFRGV